MKHELYKEFLVCPECDKALIEKKSLESKVEEFQDSQFCSGCGSNIASTYKEALATITKRT